MANDPFWLPGCTFKYNACYCSTGTEINRCQNISKIQIQLLLLFNGTMMKKKIFLSNSNTTLVIVQRFFHSISNCTCSHSNTTLVIVQPENPGAYRGTFRIRMQHLLLFNDSDRTSIFYVRHSNTTLVIFQQNGARDNIRMAIIQIQLLLLSTNAISLTFPNALNSNTTLVIVHRRLSAR